MDSTALIGFPLEIFGNFMPIFFVLIAIIANLFPGIPEEVFLITLGFLISQDKDLYSFFEIYLLISLGFLLVDSLEYYLSMKGSKITKKILEKFFRIDLNKDNLIIKKHLGKILFFSRFLVQFRALGPILSGTLHFPYKKFILIDSLAILIYTPIIMWLGFYFSNRIEKVLNGASVANTILVSIVIIILLIYLISKIRKIFLSYLAKKKEEVLK